MSKKTATLLHKNVELQTLVHDLAGPLTALTMTLPELTRVLDLDHSTKLSTKMYLELCSAATQDLHQKLKQLQHYTDILEIAKPEIFS